MSLKSSLLALANNIGMCQENARNIKQVLAGGLTEVASDAPGLDDITEIVKLWTNEHPTSAFDATDVTIKNADVYNGFLLIIMQESGNISMCDYIDSSVINDNTDHYINADAINLSAGVMKKEYRSLQLTQAADSHDIVFKFGLGKTGTIATYGTGVSASTTNGVLVPLYIIGLKY